MPSNVMFAILLFAGTASKPVPICPPTPTPETAICDYPGRQVQPYPAPRHLARARIRAHAQVAFGRAVPPPRRGDRVLIEVVVSSEGCVVDARPLQGPSRALINLVLDASRTMRFAPALADGVPVATYERLTFMVRSRRFSQAGAQDLTILTPGPE